MFKSWGSLSEGDLFCRESVLPKECPQAWGSIISQHCHRHHQNSVLCVANFLETSQTSEGTCESTQEKSHMPVLTVHTGLTKTINLGSIYLPGMKISTFKNAFNVIVLILFCFGFDFVFCEVCICKSAIGSDL